MPVSVDSISGLGAGACFAEIIAQLFWLVKLAAVAGEADLSGFGKANLTGLLHPPCSSQLRDLAAPAQGITPAPVGLDLPPNGGGTKGGDVFPIHKGTPL